MGKPVFVLVHGAFHGGWCWRRVADRLTARGGRVFTPTLTGLGERSHLLSPDINVSVHISDVANVILWEDLGNIVLCGHSYGGMVISGVAERVPDKIRSLVYVDALNPEPGACLWDYLPPIGRTEFDRTTTDGFIAPKSAAAFKVNEQDRAWVDGKSTPHPRASFFERLPSTNHRAAIPNKTYIYASGYRSPMLGKFSDAAKADPKWRHVDLPYGHDLMIDAPDEVADILFDVA